ncbi:hypothetical protein [Bradyrhizobium japonicum]|uniref:hypothetical protein n=1 Tax=Bradyrhizobium japonicum TaxID=375 RepID=UPI001FCD558B|nr:hypothetical protein [Bradyrhizobium japonicum]
MGLERDDGDLDAGVLTVRLTKLGKSRLVSLHPTTRTALRDYVHRRDALLGSRCGSSSLPNREAACFTSTFIASSGDCPDRLRCPGDRGGPRVHDFRHRFPIQTLLDWYSGRQERRAAAPSVVPLPRPRLRARYLLVSLGLPRVDGRSGAASGLAMGRDAMSPFAMSPR